MYTVPTMEFNAHTKKYKKHAQRNKNLQSLANIPKRTKIDHQRNQTMKPPETRSIKIDHVRRPRLGAVPNTSRSQFCIGVQATLELSFQPHRQTSMLLAVITALGPPPRLRAPPNLIFVEIRMQLFFHNGPAFFFLCSSSFFFFFFILTWNAYELTQCCCGVGVI